MLQGDRTVAREPHSTDGTGTSPLLPLPGQEGQQEGSCEGGSELGNSERIWLCDQRETDNNNAREKAISWSVGFLLGSSLEDARTPQKDHFILVGVK